MSIHCLSYKWMCFLQVFFHLCEQAGRKYIQIIVNNWTKVRKELEAASEQLASIQAKTLQSEFPLQKKMDALQEATSQVRPCV